MRFPLWILGTAGLCSLVLAPLTHAQTFTDLYNFQGSTDGGNPFASLLLDNAGNLYGTTYSGGAYNSNCSYPGCGVVYKLDTTGNETPLYTFTGTPDGQNPVAAVVTDPAGNFYGTTAYGGANGYGTVFMVNAAGVEKVLQSFTGGADGGIPNGGLVRDKDGNLYGTTYSGGSANLGTLFKVTPASVFNTIYTFPDTAHGSHPNAALALAPSGDLYGTTQYGGASNRGTVFSLEPGSSAATVLYSFSGMPDGAYPQAQLTFHGADLSGTTTEGGSSNNDTVFKLTSSGTETILHNFAGNPDGSYPMAGLVIDKAGNLYGTTFHGGSSGSPGVGIVYKIDTSGNETLLYSFQGSFDSQWPASGLILNSAATAVYGTTYLSGFDCCGDVYSVTLP
jgi:uncharacterized repeat protein (TIGR03803 family)